MSTKYKLYNFLPLVQNSPIACHVNGYFALHQENRTQLFENYKHANLIDTNTAEWCTKWNTALINLIVLPLYLDSMKIRIDHLKELVNKNDKSDSGNELESGNYILINLNTHKQRQ